MQDIIAELVRELHGDTRRWVSLAIWVGAVAIGHFLITLIVRAGLSRTRSENWWRYAMRQIRWPTFWIAVAIALSLGIRGIGFRGEVRDLWHAVAGLWIPALCGWLAIRIIRIARFSVERGSDISVPDNLRARRRRTRMHILARIAMFAVVFVTISIMLLSIPSIRSVGFSLLASAGLAGLAVGAAAQPALKNLIAGVQMAFTEPIRIDDVVIMEGEWGRIEEIRLTYVVIALWDERRLIVPVSRFLEQPFQNWTRTTSRILGTVFLYLDPTADVQRIRDKVHELLPQNSRWDGRVEGVQVTDMKAETMEVRILVSAADSGQAFDLRCDLREALLAFIRDEMPEALPRRRGLVQADVEISPEPRPQPHSSP